MLRPFALKRLGTCQANRRSRRGFTSPSVNGVPGEASSTSPAAAGSTDPSTTAADAGTRPNADSNISRLLNVLRKAAQAQTAPKPAGGSDSTTEGSSTFEISPEDKANAAQWKKEYGMAGKTRHSSAELLDSLSREAPDIMSDMDPFNIVDDSVKQDAALGLPRKPKLRRPAQSTTTEPDTQELSKLMAPLSASSILRTPRPRRVTTPSAAESEPWPPKIPEDPFKVLLLHVDANATDSDIRLGFQSLDLEKDLQIKRIETFTEPRGKAGKLVHAFVSVATQEDYDTILSDTVRPFGVYINGSRCSLSSVADRRIVYIRNLSKIEDESQLRRMLADFTIDTSAIERIELGLTDGVFTGSCNVFFKSHSEAYKAIRYLNNLDGKQRFAPNEAAMSAAWGRQGILQEMKKRKDELDRENKSLKEQISRLSDEVKKMDHVETIADVRLSNVIFKRTLEFGLSRNFTGRLSGD
eukprot:TRINITY_DN882_c0_g1_i1.p1 TRINITY_DN882_c0_g1~~TRINITY_DN882_c0_g1_i1.p1  ORF type:complete len:469 (-),score=96.72 TRINITY_DN882_c0_g1_i1:1055-2461(-)